MKRSSLIMCLCLFVASSAPSGQAQQPEPVAGPKGLYGYKNCQTGELVIPFQFDIAFPFVQGLAYVAKDSIGSFIDLTGRLVASGSINAPTSFSEGLALIRTAVRGEYKYGYIDATGKVSIPPIFDDAYPFSAGLALVSLDKRLYYIDREGDIVIDVDPYAAHPFSGTIAMVGNKEGLWGCIDTTGKFIVNYRYNQVGFFSQGMASVRWGEFWGLINDKGEQMVPCTYKRVGLFRDNRATVQYDQLWGYIDRTGGVVIPMEYTFASPFVEGLACVQKKLWGYIDTLGKMVIKLQYDRAFPFSNGLACVYRNGRYGFIDRTGKTVINFNYREADVFSNGLAAVGNGRKYGFIDVEGNLVIPMEYDRRGRFDDRGLAQVIKNGQTYLINKRGERVRTIDSLRVDVKPKFQGGNENSFGQWVSSRIKYPSDLVRFGIQGTVIISFVVDIDGSVTDIEVLRSIHPDLDQESIRVISSSPKWTPGMQGNKPV